jgi:DegV family protein with EDD domain
MNTQKIAILTDSGTDTPPEYIEKYNIFVAPLVINYKEGEYRDRIDITPEEVAKRLATEIPKTSLPSGGVITDILEKVKEQGYEKLLVITISSGLSGTFGLMKVVSENFKGLDIRFVDTKNIGLGAGLTVVRACELIEKGLDIDEIEPKLQSALKNTKLFFCVATLEYLKKGGRIGLVTGIVGTALGIKPVISCNEDGIYYTAKISRGRQKSLESACDMIEEYSKGSPRYNLAVAHAGAPEEAASMAEAMKKRLGGIVNVFFGQISPSLVVHTGPAVIGIGLQRVLD